MLNKSRCLIMTRNVALMKETRATYEILISVNRGK